jgi:hypothetical protein
MKDATRGELFDSIKKTRQKEAGNSAINGQLPPQVAMPLNRCRLPRNLPHVTRQTKLCAQHFVHEKSIPALKPVEIGIAYFHTPVAIETIGSLSFNAPTAAPSTPIPPVPRSG